MTVRSLAAASMLVLALGTAGSAAARSHTVTAARATSDPYLAVELAYLGLDKATLAAKLKQGQSLAQIATAQGKSPQGLINALVATAKVKLDAKVKAGTLTKKKEAGELATLRVQVGKLVQKSFGPTVKIPSVYLTPILAYLQISAQALQKELKAGKSLAQIAIEHGKTAAGVEAAILGPIQAQLDAQVAAGKLTSAQRDALLAQLQANVAKIVAGTA